MDATLQVILQGGALGILAYLIFWVTRSGGPKLFDALFGIKSAMEAHTLKLEQFERTNDRLVDVVSRLARETKEIGEETLNTLKEKNGP